MNIFEERTFNQEQLNIIKVTVDDTIQSLLQKKDLEDHIKDNLKAVCDRLNENIESKASWIKPKTLMKIAKTKMKENLQEQKEEVSEAETGLKIIDNL